MATVWSFKADVFRALAFCQSEWQRARNISFETPYSGQSTLSAVLAIHDNLLNYDVFM